MEPLVPTLVQRGLQPNTKVFSKNGVFLGSVSEVLRSSIRFKLLTPYIVTVEIHRKFFRQYPTEDKPVIVLELATLEIEAWVRAGFFRP